MQSNSYLTFQLPQNNTRACCLQPKNSSYNLSSPFILYLCHTLKIYKPKYYKTMAKELELKYGCNPNQKPSRIFMQEGELPIEVLNGRPGYINFSGRFQQLATGQRIERSYRTTRSSLLQACQSGRSRSRNRVE